MLELKMRIGKVVQEEEKMMYALSEMGEEGLEWYVGLESKPTIWEELKTLIVEKWDLEDETLRRKQQEKEQREDVEFKMK
jgi:hypothetical protein